MKEQIIELSQKIIDIIYTPDQDGLNQMFIKLLDLLMDFLSENSALENESMAQVFLDMQTAFTKKDYGELADVLHYDLCESMGSV